MKAAEALIVWTPGNDESVGPSKASTIGQVKVGPLLDPDVNDWTRGYSMSGGAASVDRRHMADWEQVAMMMIEFHTIVVRDGVDPQVAHKAFLAIDEYRAKISPDIPGADQ